MTKRRNAHETINLADVLCVSPLAVVVGVEQRGQRILQLRVERAAVLKGRLDLRLHGWKKNILNDLEFNIYTAELIERGRLSVKLSNPDT